MKEFVIYVEDHIIYIKVFGTWNERIFKAFEQAMEETIKDVKKPFVEILDLRKWKIGTLDMINLAVDRHKRAFEAGREYHLTIAKKSAMSYLIAQNHIYKRTEVFEENRFVQFEEVDSCCRFLEENQHDTSRIKKFIRELETMPYEDTDLFMSV